MSPAVHRRPGARREATEAYIQRLKDLESLAMSYNGVTKAFAIQAGRELRVMVESERITDAQSDELSISIADRIMKALARVFGARQTLTRDMGGTASTFEFADAVCKEIAR